MRIFSICESIAGDGVGLARPSSSCSEGSVRNVALVELVGLVEPVELVGLVEPVELDGLVGTVGCSVEETTLLILCPSLSEMRNQMQVCHHNNKVSMATVAISTH